MSLCLSLSLFVEYSVEVLRGLSGEVIWSRPLKEPVSFVQCGLQREGSPPVCLLISPSQLTALNATSGDFATAQLCVSSFVSILSISGRFCVKSPGPTATHWPVY